MKFFKNKISIIILAIAFTLGLGGIVAVRAVAPQPTVNLGGASSFAILAGTPNITETGGHASSVTGDVGLSPATSSGIQLFCSQISVLSKIYGVDTAYTGGGFGTACFHGTPSDKTIVDNAKLALTAAYTNAAGRTPVTIVPTELGGTTKFAGVYASDSTAFGITAGAGPLILDGQDNPDAVFIFEGSDASAGALTVGPGSEVQLTGQAQACNVFWRFYGAGIATTAKFKGSILALTSITVASGADIEGRLLARNGNVTLDNAKITVPTCTSTGTLHVIKTLTNDSGGTLHNENFSFLVNGGSPVAFESDGTNDLTVDAGTYSVTETAVAGYATSYNTCTNVVIAGGGSATCTITNNDIAPHLIVIKHVVNDNGGSALASAFITTITGVATASQTADGVESPGVDNTLTSVGTYSVDEGEHAGYTKSFSGDCSGTIALGQTKTCTITNDDIAPILRLRKIINGGTATVADFPLTANGEGANDISGTSPVDGGAGLLADTFTLSETNPGGYTASAWVCVGGSQSGSNITLAINEEATCTITNTYIDPVSGGGGTVYGCKDPAATNYNAFSASNPALCVYANIPVVIPPVITPLLPKTGFPPETWYEFLFNNILNLFR